MSSNRKSRLTGEEYKQARLLLGEGPKYTALSGVPEPIYKATIDGFNSAAFHQRCDLTEGTVSIIWTDNCAGILGGRTSMRWNTANQQYSADPMAYLIQLKANGSLVQDGKLHLRQSTDTGAIYCRQDYGPTFGQGHDLRVHLQNKTFSASSRTYAAPTQPFSNQSSHLNEVEVFAADDFFGDGTNEPFQNMPDTATLQRERKELLTELQEFDVPFDGVRSANVLLFGHAGAGKSSFLRCADTIMQNRFSYIADTGTATASLTRKLRKLPLRPNVKSMLRLGLKEVPAEYPMRLWDTMGWSDTAYQHGELGPILDGHVPNNFVFDDTTTISPRSPGYIRDPHVKDTVHVILVLVAASEVCTDDVAATIKTNLALTRRRDIRTILVLTKIDEVDERLAEEPHMGDHSEIVDELVTAAAAATGVATDDILAIKNYTKERSTSLKVEVPVLKVLVRAMYAAHDYFRNLADTDSVPQENHASWGRQSKRRRKGNANSSSADRTACAAGASSH
eukprot:m.745703 g.745703  ORF g.745703 m.745703 type:complete len:508 (+) comp23127_c4_seq21:125-1648(+)